MGRSTRTAAVCAAVCLHAVAATAQGTTMTLADVLARARDQAPRIVSARLESAEARGRLAGASLRWQNNPTMDVALGNRTGTSGRFTDVELGLDQQFEPGARRAARIAGANAAIAEGSANIDDVTRAVLRDATTAFYRVLHAKARIALLDAAAQVASSVHAAADRRFKAGDIAVLDVNIARASLARATAEREAAEASKAVALGELRQLLGIGGDLDVNGTLTPSTASDLPTALEAAHERPELRALQAGIEEAEAEARLGDSYGKPNYGAGVTYAREEGDQIVLGRLTIALPAFARGQQQSAVGSARAARLRMELDAARGRVQQEVRTAFDAYSRRLAAVRVLEADAIPGLDENERLTARSFEVGQLGLPELLLIRREILDTRVQHLDALLEAALARTDLDASAAILR